MEVHIKVTRPAWLPAKLRWRTRIALTLVALLAVAVPVAWASHDFADVPTGHQFHNQISAIKGAGITQGCGGGNYCPDESVRRDAMAAFMHRGFGRTTGTTLVSGPNLGSGSGTGPLVDIATVTITVPGTSGTQFVNVYGESMIFTNSTKAATCTDTVFCQVYLYLYDGATQLARSFYRFSGDGAGATVPVSYVQAVTGGSTKTYTMKAQALNVNTNLAFIFDRRLRASTFPFGGSGGATITATGSAVPSERPTTDPTSGGSR